MLQTSARRVQSRRCINSQTDATEERSILVSPLLPQLKKKIDVRSRKLLKINRRYQIVSEGPPIVIHHLYFSIESEIIIILPEMQ